MGDPMTPEALEAIRARLAAATPGPWTLPYHDGALAGPHGASLLGLDVDGMAIVWARADAELIAHAPADIAALLAEVERLRAEVAERVEAERVADARLREWLSSDAEAERLRAVLAYLAERDDDAATDLWRTLDADGRERANAVFATMVCRLRTKGDDNA